MSLFSVARLLLVLLYALGSLGIFWGVPTQRRKIQTLGRLFTLGGFALHTLLLLVALLLDGANGLSNGYFLSLLAWSILLIYFVTWRRLQAGFLTMAAVPLVFLLMVLALRLDHTQGRLPQNIMELLFTLQILPMFISLGLLALAFGAGVLYLRLERKIKHKSRLSEFDRELPALNSFDRINARTASAGFPLYTLALATGFIAMSGQGAYLSLPGGWDPKEVVSLFVWFFYALFFYLRLIKGWRGRKTALLAIFIFGVSVFSLLGVNFFLPTHHSFSAACL
jgi:ABC-type transport system involved in cytochrome c biogenesis permease subunit